MQSHNGSNDTALDPPLLSFYNILKTIVRQPPGPSALCPGLSNRPSPTVPGPAQKMYKGQGC
jgi:hypothetical protein